MRHVYGSVFTLVFTFLGYFLAKCLVVILWAWFGDLGRLLDFAKACFGRLDLFWFVWIFFGLVGFISVWYACLDVSGLLFVCWIFLS